jgi:hypothetical protein
MSTMFEVYYKAPTDSRRESALEERVSQLGGRLTYREGHENGAGSICLTFEFADHDRAEEAAVILRRQGEHIEGPGDY